MSKLGNLRKKWGYEHNVPCCQLCAAYQPQRLVLRDSLPIARSPAVCKDGGFTIKPNGVCDRWHTKQGERLAS